LKSSKMPSTSPIENPLGDGRPSLGTLFVVATPIGHMEDITLRAIRVLTEVTLIAAEDTRHTRKLLTRHKISTPLVSLHDHNKEQRTPQLLEKLRSGLSIAVVSDAGTPSVSDPGYYLVRHCVQEGVNVVPVPGVSAVIAALSVSGLPSDSFVFIGFLPRNSNRRLDLLGRLQTEPRTLVFYESPKRLVKLLEDIVRLMGDREAVLARELTKIHEEIIRGTAGEILKRLSERPVIKGECTLLVSGDKNVVEVDRKELHTALRRIRREQNRPLAELAKEVAARYGLSRRLVYKEALEMDKEDPVQHDRVAHDGKKENRNPRKNPGQP
jgi:16S rRNA (cytidine1402-2'-O)-methyltransferase